MTMWLIGMMGAGKTSAGAEAAAALGVPFRDTDLEVVEETGSSIQELWDSIGERAFRDLESVVVKRLAGSAAIVATGGGVVVDGRNREAMSRSGKVVWLQAPPEVLLARVGSDGERPLLATADDALTVLSDIAASREPWYRGLADHVIDTSERSVDEVARELEVLWER
jgi:shikimate kinase